MLAGAFLMVIGAGLYVFAALTAAAWMFAVGAVAFASMQLQQTYNGRNTAVRRLRKIMSVGDALFILSAALLYVNYIHNNWVVLLLVAAILEIYTTHRISNELKKEGQPHNGQA